MSLLTIDRYSVVILEYNSESLFLSLNKLSWNSCSHHIFQSILFEYGRENIHQRTNNDKS